MSLIQVRSLSKSFGKNLVLDNIDLDINENEIFGIIGVNGSGKTTLLKSLVGFYKPEHGAVFYNSKPLAKVMKQIKHSVGFTTQENSFYPKLTVIENVKYFGSLYGLHHHGPKKYPFVMHALALFMRQACRLSYRRVAKLLRELGFLVPTYSALCKMNRRAALVLVQLFEQTCTFTQVCVASLDATTLSRSLPSWHYIPAY